MEPIGPDYIYELTNVSEPSLSSDGSEVAFAISSFDRKRVKKRSVIMIMSLLNRKVVQLTHGMNDHTPRFSPDGLKVAFVRKDSKGRNQIWIKLLPNGDIQRITNLSGGVRDHTWSPDSRHLAFVSDVDVTASHSSNSNGELIGKVARSFRYKLDNVGWRENIFSQLFVVEIDSGVTTQLTHSNGDYRYPIWSPDAQKIAYVSDIDVNRDVNWHTQCYVTKSDGTETQQWSKNLYSVGAIGWSPNGDKLVVVGSDDQDIGDPILGPQSDLFILQNDQMPLKITHDSVSPVQPAHEINWNLDDRILFLGESRGETFLYQALLKENRLESVAGGDSQLSGLSIDQLGETSVVLVSSPNSFGDLNLLDISQGTLTPLTSYNKEFFSNHPMGTMDKFNISRGELEIESRLILPPDFKFSNKYPMILDIHGGPHSKFTDSFSAAQQILSTAGYIVLAVNPRGSSSYGADFAKAVLGDWGGEDYLDILSAVDHVCKYTYVDRNRLGVYGYSYGGFMSAWIIGHDTRFSAAVVGAPCINLVSMYGTSDIGVTFGETQWGDMSFDSLMNKSPVSYVNAVETPVLLMHGENDLRCPVSQSEEYFVRLNRLGKKVEMVRFPGQSHQFLRNGHPKLISEYYRRMLDWFGRYI